MYGPPHASVNDTTAEYHHDFLPHHPSLQGSAYIDDEDIVQCSSQIGYNLLSNSHSPLAHAVMELSVDESNPNAIYASDMAPPVGPSVGEGSADQLTLSFQGEVYVFDSVSPEKVQTVLLMLGGYEVPSGITTTGMAPENLRNLGDYPVRSSQPQRAASLNRFREKRKERCFDKKVRYNVRKEVALRMQRKKGQFTSSMSVGDELGSHSTDWNGNSGHEGQETLCWHCGNSSENTPMMRHGPDGPTLCNACGLKWVNKLNGEANGGVTALPPTNIIMSDSELLCSQN